MRCRTGTVPVTTLSVAWNGPGSEAATSELSWRRARNPKLLFALEQAEIDRLAQQEIAVGRRMHAVAAIIGRIDNIGIAGVAHQLVEVEDRVEAGVLANPVVDLVLDLGLVVAPAGVGNARNNAVARDDRHPDDLDALLLNARDDILKAGDDLLGGCSAADVIGAEEHDHVADARVRQHIAI